MRHMEVKTVDRVRLTSQLICLGWMDATVSMMEVSNSMADQLLACLIQGTAKRYAQECELSHVSTHQ